MTIPAVTRMPPRHVPSRLARERLAALVVLAVLAACSGDDPSAPQEAAPLDVPALLAEMASVPGVPGAAAVAPFVRVPTVPASCAHVAASQSFVCPPITEGGLTLTVAYTLLDAAGRPLAQPDRNAAAIRTLTTAKGTITAPATSGVAGTMTLDQRQEQTLSGLLTGTHRLDGTGTTRMTGTVQLGAQSVPLDLTSTQTVSGLVLPSGGAAGAARWPTAGTITVVSTTGGLPGAASAVRLVMAFDGTSTATVTVTIGGLTQRCTVNLASPAALPVCTG